MKLIDLTGNVYGKLTVIERGLDALRGGGVPRWWCQCSCGKKVLVEGADLRKKKDGTKTCGCGGEGIGGSKNKIHGYTHFNFYPSFLDMHRRCYDKECVDYKDYGGRGIKVCERWYRDNKDGIENFYNDMGDRPDNFTLERVDVNVDYSPENCKWISKGDQNKNKRNSKLLLFNGNLLNQNEISRIIGITPGHFAYRLKRDGSADNVYKLLLEKRKQGLINNRQRLQNDY